MKRVLMYLKSDDRVKSDILKMFSENGFECKMIADQNELKDADLSDVEVVLGNVDVCYIEKMPSIKWLSLTTSGADKYTGRIRDDIILTNARGAFGHAISEYMVGAVFNIFKGFHLYRDNQREEVWKKERTAKSVSGSTVLIIGMGDIGSSFAAAMKKLGCYIIGVRRTDKKKPECFDEVYIGDGFDKAFQKADIVALCVPENDDTIGILNRRRIEMLKEGCCVVNVGRGSAIDSEALCDALQNERIFGAVLDVFETEPLPAGDRLWKMKNAVLTPHISQKLPGIHEPEGYISRLLIENCSRYLKGEELVNRINPTNGYPLD
ncbi:MAG: D-2-hydroxyacid dehydrogenase [Ruminococcaceae bacterium]|nr:D-2-hydroxyacid dehydrogenase [Oscillospiraceae bacterium]